MDQRLSLVTLGVADIDRARTFYEALGWSGESPDGEVVFFQVGALILALWDRSKLAMDSVVDDGAGWGGVTLAYNTASPEDVDVTLSEAGAAGATIGRAGAPATLLSVVKPLFWVSGSANSGQNSDESLGVRTCSYQATRWQRC
jgi:catechol 2,3-dioxygenase-like lactoylglutathione lyase family enzyme